MLDRHHRRVAAGLHFIVSQGFLTRVRRFVANVNFLFFDYFSMPQANQLTIDVRTFSNGVYLGSMRSSDRHGPGKYWFKSGRVYAGEFADNKRHGMGKLTLLDGTVREGRWEQGVFKEAGDATAAVEAATFNGVAHLYSYSKLASVIGNLGKDLPTCGEAIKAMRDHPHVEVRVAVVKALGQDLPTYGETIKEMRGDPHYHVREAVVKALGQDLPTYGETIKEMRGDSWFHVRVAVVRAFGQDPATYIEELKAMSDDPFALLSGRWPVRGAVEDLVEKLAEDLPTNIDTIKAFATAPGSAVRAAAFEAFGQDPLEHYETIQAMGEAVQAMGKAGTNVVNRALHPVMDNREFKLLCWRGDDKFEVTAHMHKFIRYPYTREEAEASYDDWLLEIATAHPVTWLPIDPGMIAKLQALATTTTATAAAADPTAADAAVAAASQYKWFGIVSGGGRMPLPSSYVAAVFAPAKLAEAETRADAAAAAPPSGLKWREVDKEKTSNGTELENGGLREGLKQKTEFTREEWDAFDITELRIDHFIQSGELYFQPAAAGKRPTPVDVSDVGAAGSSWKTGLASASAVKTTAGVGAFAPASATVATAVVGAPEVRFPQGDKDYCVAYSAASAVHHAGDKKAAAAIYQLAALSLKQPVGVNRVKWVQQECRNQLQPGWRTLSKPLKNVQQMSKVDLLALLATPGVVTVIQLEDSEGNIRHCVAAHGGWLFDPNKPRAVPLDANGLDACCLDDATFVKAYAGFQLVRSSDMQAVPKRSAGENGSSNASPVAKKARKA